MLCVIINISYLFILLTFTGSRCDRDHNGFGISPVVSDRTGPFQNSDVPRLVPVHFLAGPFDLYHFANRSNSCVAWSLCDSWATCLFSLIVTATTWCGCLIPESSSYYCSVHRMAVTISSYHIYASCFSAILRGKLCKMFLIQTSLS